jgi:hypothetical protein
MWANSVIFKKMPKLNNRKLGVNSPNPVTLIGGNIGMGPTIKIAAN